MDHDLKIVEKRDRWTWLQCASCGAAFKLRDGDALPADLGECGGKRPIAMRKQPIPVPVPGPPLVSSGPVPTIPIRELPHPYFYRGVCAVKPWEYQVTVALPCLDHAEETAVCVELLRAQTVKPFFVLVDTGSKPEELAKLEAMRAADVEVHRLALNGTRYTIDPIAIALDLCFSRADTPHVFTTHQDCFVRRRDFLEYLVREIEGHAVVGWQLSPRFHADWRQMFGHTATLFDMAAWDTMGATWTLRRAARDGEKKRDDPVHCEGCWPDTESAMNMTLLRCGAKTKLLGSEENYTRNKDEWIDHVRSLVCSSLYNPQHNAKARSWMVDAMREARERLAAWREPPPTPQGGPGTELKMLLRRMGIVSRGCKCDERARQMDEWGIDGCKKNAETIVDWLAEEAAKRHLPFVRAAGRLLVKRAVRNARRKQEAMTR